MNMAGNVSLRPCARGGPKPFCRNRETYTNNTCVSHTKGPFEFDMFDAEDLQANGPHNTTMPYTANNAAYLGVPWSFGPGWNHATAERHGVDVGGTVHPEMSKVELELAARALLGL
jgi:hypothetical protein